MKIAICDNDEEDLKVLCELISQIMDEYAIICEIHDFRRGEDLLQSNIKFQLIFLETMMNGINGIELGNEIYRRNRRTGIIFQTNHRTNIIFQVNHGKYYMEALNRSHPFAFLEKPLSRWEVKNQIEDFIERYINAKDIQLGFKKVKVIQNGLLIAMENVNLLIDEIIYFECLKAKKRVRIVTEVNEYEYLTTMNDLEERMKPLGFEISCRGMLVNLEKILKIERYTIYMSNGKKTSLSQRRALKFKERMNNYLNYIII